MVKRQNKHGKSSKAGRNFRLNGQITTQTKYVRSGGPQRMAKRKAANHECGLPGLHLGKQGERDFQHAHKKKGEHA